MHSLYFRFSGTIVLKIWVRYRAVRNYFNIDFKPSSREWVEVS